MGMLCNRRGGCFAAGCFSWGCPQDQCCSSTVGGCCGGGGSPPNIFQMITDPCYKKQWRNSMQLVYGAYYGGCYTGRSSCMTNQNPCGVPPLLPNYSQPTQEPIRVVFKCPTYCTPLPPPVITC